MPIFKLHPLQSLGGPGLAEAINNTTLAKKPFAQITTPLLCHYEQHIEDTNIEPLYFPAHVSTNHWISIHIDCHK